MGNGSDDGLSAVALVGMDGFAVTGHVHRDGELWLAVETTKDRAWVPRLRRPGDRERPATGAGAGPAGRRDTDGAGVGETPLAVPRDPVSTGLVVRDVAAHRTTGVADGTGPAGDLPARR